MKEKYFSEVNFLKDCSWWEKSVEYHFVQLLVKNLLLKKTDGNKEKNENVFVNCAPLAGVEEQFIGDAIFKTLNTYYIIEFKKECQSIKSEASKYVTTKKEYASRFKEEFEAKKDCINLKLNKDESNLTDEEKAKKINIFSCNIRYEIAKETLLESHEKFIKNHIFIYGDMEKTNNGENKFSLKVKDYWGYYPEQELDLSNHLKNNISYSIFSDYVKDLIQWRGFNPWGPGGPGVSGKNFKFDNLIVFAIDGLGNPTIIEFERILKCITGDDNHFFSKSYDSRLNEGHPEDAANDENFGLAV